MGQLGFWSQVHHRLSRLSAQTDPKLPHSILQEPSWHFHWETGKAFIFTVTLPGNELRHSRPEASWFCWLAPAKAGGEGHAEDAWIEPWKWNKYADIHKRAVLNYQWWITVYVKSEGPSFPMQLGCVRLRVMCLSIMSILPFSLLSIPHGQYRLPSLCTSPAHPPSP